MPWIWTDDIARLLVERGIASSAEVLALTSAPFAIQSPATDDDSIVAVGMTVIGRAEEGAA